MTTKYSHLGQEQRYQIEALLKAGKSQSFIAGVIGCHRSTISRELKRNTAQSGPNRKQYSGTYAQFRVNRRLDEHYPNFKFNEFMRQRVVHWLQKDQLSPELITKEGRIKYGSFVSHETIYKWIWQMKHSQRAQDLPYRHLYEYLKHQGRRRKRSNYKENRGSIPNRNPIEQRPAQANNRKRIGDLEIDLVLGKNHRPGLLIMTDRATLFTRIKKINTKKADVIAKKITSTLMPHQQWVKTLTYDNDLAFAQHEKVNKSINTFSYFTRPYCSQDKGTVENRIWQLRRFFPKGTDFEKVTHQQVKRVEKLLNNRRVKKFDYQTPNAVFLQMSSVALET